MKLGIMSKAEKDLQEPSNIGLPTQRMLKSTEKR